MKHLYLRSISLAALVVMLALAACGPAGLPDTGGQETLESLPPEAVLDVVEHLGQELNISVDNIEIVEIEQVDWPDACLGIPQEGQACAQVVTPGYHVVLEVNGQEYEFRTDQEGAIIIEVPSE